MTATVGRVIAVADEALANTSYLVDAGEGCGLLVDPRRDIETYQHLAAEHGLTVTAAVETHLHADFVSGARELADAGITVFAAREAAAQFPHEAVSGGDRITVGACTVDVFATPGHTPEHVAFLLHPPAGVAHLFSGGSLIHGGAARTDLSGRDRTAALTAAQYASVQLLGALNAQTWLHPTHGAGSFCSVGPAGSEPSTVGAERALNDLLTAAGAEEFTERLLDRLGSYPPYFVALRAVNQRGADRRDALPAPRALSASAAADAQSHGAIIIDTRELPAWSAGSPSGAISNVLRPAFASWLGWIVPTGTPMIWLAASDGDAREATQLARRIGHDQVLGWIDGGIDAWQDAELPVSSVALLTPAQAEADTTAAFLDVRQHGELTGRVIPGAVHLELGAILAGAVPPRQRVITYCGHGERSATAASVLAARGINVASLAGGTDAWTATRRHLT